MGELRKIREIKPDPEYLAIMERAPESLMKRLEAMACEAGSQLQGFPVGRMKLRGELGEHAEAKFSAAVWFFGLHARHQHIIGAKGVAPQSMELGSKGEPLDPDTDRGREMTRQEKRITREYTSAKLAGLACGAGDWAYFLAVVIQEQDPNWPMKTAVRRVTDALRRHRALASRQRQGRR